MHCRFCGHLNREGDARCAYCDGRLQPPPVVSGRSSAVPALQEETQPVPVVRPERPPSANARQASLFDRGNVITFPAPPGRRPRASSTETRSTVEQPSRVDRPAPASRANTTQSTKTLSDTILSGTQERLMGISGQQRLDLLPHDAHTPSLCRSDLAVAAPLVRLKAAAFDALLIAVGMAISLVPFFLLGGAIVTTPKALTGYAAYAAVLALFYKAIWCVLKRESFGMARYRIRLVNFDGERPGAGARWTRLAAVLLGTLAAGLGLLWALMDQERLAWHDHISKTYPTVDNPNPGTFHRR